MSIEKIQNFIKKEIITSKNNLNVNKSRLNGIWIKNNHPEKYKMIFKFTNFLNESDPIFIQRLWHLHNNKLFLIKCERCNNLTKFRNFKFGYHNFCGNKCINITKKGLEKKQLIENNKKINPTDLKELINFINCNFFDVNGRLIPVFMRKNGKFLKNKYPKVFEQILFFSKFLNDLNPNVSQRIWHIMNEDWNKFHRCKICNNLTKFKGFSVGYNNTCSIECSKKIADQTSKNNYFNNNGVYHYLQNSKLIDNYKNGYKKSWHNYKLPSGKEIKLQGYEPQVLDLLLKEYNENEILYKKSDMPEIWYVDTSNKKHRYYPDFYIPKNNLIIEVKSSFTYKVNLKINLLKEKATKKVGYKYKLFIPK